MEYLSEDPTYLAGGLGLLAASFLIALRITQQGKYLVWGLSTLALLALVLLVELVWVTDNERIELAVYSLGRAVSQSDVEGVLDRLTPDVQLVIAGASTPGPATRELIRSRISGSRFDFLRVSHLRANAGGQSRRGTAEFRVVTSGSFDGPYNTLNFGTTNSTWSLGFRESGAGVWKVNRITPASVPGLQYVLSFGGRSAPRGPQAPRPDYPSDPTNVLRGLPVHTEFRRDGRRFMPAGPMVPSFSPNPPMAPAP